MGVDATSLFSAGNVQKPDYQVVAQNFYDPPVFGQRPIQRYDQFRSNQRQELIMQGDFLLEQFRHIYGMPLSNTRDMADHKYNTEAEKRARLYLPEYADIYCSHNVRKMKKFFEKTGLANCEMQAQFVNELANNAGYNSKIIMVTFSDPRTGELISHYAAAIAPKGFNDWKSLSKVAQNAIVIDTWAHQPEDRPTNFMQWLANTQRTFGGQHNPQINILESNGDEVNS